MRQELNHTLNWCWCLVRTNFKKRKEKQCREGGDSSHNLPAWGADPDVWPWSGLDLVNQGTPSSEMSMWSLWDQPETSMSLSGHHWDKYFLVLSDLTGSVSGYRHGDVSGIVLPHRGSLLACLGRKPSRGEERQREKDWDLKTIAESPEDRVPKGSPFNGSQWIILFMFLPPVTGGPGMDMMLHGHCISRRMQVTQMPKSSWAMKSLPPWDIMFLIHV